ncbi:unnamed protein product [Protopolystoma xenopodis]|uniref:Uncharacterized protein n=1 Tax=Protopolystoma xenopodis TaxID=117903 RepID=A0A448XAN0_9PLAT|nr:unnamed protein product [Protopolystoma xenopodis]
MMCHPVATSGVDAGPGNGLSGARPEPVYRRRRLGATGLEPTDREARGGANRGRTKPAVHETVVKLTLRPERSSSWTYGLQLAPPEAVGFVYGTSIFEEWLHFSQNNTRFMPVHHSA